LSVAANILPAMQVWHPWRTLGTHFPHIVVSCEYQLPEGVRGWWRGNTIWLCKTLNQAERRSTLTHELLHVTRGLAPRDLREREERRVDELAARKLIPLPELLHGLQWSTNDDELAEALWTDVHTVRVRRETLTPIEIAWLDKHLDDEMQASAPRRTARAPRHDVVA